MHPGRVVPQIIRVWILVSTRRQGVRLRFKLDTACQTKRWGKCATEGGKSVGNKRKLDINEATTRVRPGGVLQRQNSAIRTTIPKSNIGISEQPPNKNHNSSACRYLVPVCVVIESQKHLGEKVHAEVVDATGVQLGHPLDVFRGVRPTKHLIQHPTRTCVHQTRS